MTTRAPPHTHTHTTPQLPPLHTHTRARLLSHFPPQHALKHSARRRTHGIRTEEVPAAERARARETARAPAPSVSSVHRIVYVYTRVLPSGTALCVRRESGEVGGHRKHKRAPCATVPHRAYQRALRRGPRELRAPASMACRRRARARAGGCDGSRSGSLSRKPRASSRPRSTHASSASREGGTSPSRAGVQVGDAQLERDVLDGELARRGRDLPPRGQTWNGAPANGARTPCHRGAAGGQLRVSPPSSAGAPSTRGHADSRPPVTPGTKLEQRSASISAARDSKSESSAKPSPPRSGEIATCRRPAQRACASSGNRCSSLAAASATSEGPSGLRAAERSAARRSPWRGCPRAAPRGRFRSKSRRRRAHPPTRAATGARRSRAAGARRARRRRRHGTRRGSRRHKTRRRAR